MKNTKNADNGKIAPVCVLAILFIVLMNVIDFNCKITDGDRLIPIALTYHQNESMWTISK